MAKLNLVNVFARDFKGLAGFYQKVFDFPEIREYRSSIFRCLDAGQAALGFNAFDAYELINVRQPRRQARPDVKVFINIEARSKKELEQRVEKALKYGARLLKEPYITYYNFYQAVLEDPEGNVFRVNRVLPRPRSGR